MYYFNARQSVIILNNMNMFCSVAGVEPKMIIKTIIRTKRKQRHQEKVSKLIFS